MASWYLVYTKPKQEGFLGEKFRDSGFEVFNPKLKQKKHVRGKIKEVVSPLFPCYLFVKFKFPDSYKFVKYTRGVRNVVGSDGVPLMVPEEIITAIQERMKDGAITAKPPNFEPGEEVIINDGPLKDLEAVFEGEVKGHDRVYVLIKAMNARAVVSGYMLKKGA